MIFHIFSYFKLSQFQTACESSLFFFYKFPHIYFGFLKTINYNGKCSKKEMNAMFQTILMYLRGEFTSIFSMTERARQYCTWGARNFVGIEATDGCYGVQFNVSGLLHKGRVRIYYNIGTDYFDVELLRARKDEVVWSCDDIDCFQLHNVLHRHIERTDDPEV